MNEYELRSQPRTFVEGRLHTCKSPEKWGMEKFSLVNVVGGLGYYLGLDT